MKFLAGKTVVFIDFEFNHVSDEFVNLVCATTLKIGPNGFYELKEWWLHKDTFTQMDLREYLEDNVSEVIFGYAAVAEGRSFLSLGLNPPSFRWVDGFIEYRCLTNHNDDLLYGEQLVDGKVKKTRKPPPKWERTEEDSLGAFKPTHSLAEATFKLTGTIRDTEHKNKMRDLIISTPEDFTPEERKDIQAYCTEDVVFLPEILEKILEKYDGLGIVTDDEFWEEMCLRGKYAAITAKMESWGYPIDYEKTQNFSKAVGPIIEECQREINSLFPHIKPFKWNRPDRRFSWDQKITKEWLRDNVDIERWTKTDGFKKAKKEAKKAGLKEVENPHMYCSLSLDAWSKVFDYKHDYPKDNFGAQMVRYLKLKQNLNGFVPSKKGSFWDAVGSDQRVRPYMNIYGSLSSRSQPGSRSFLFLKPAWMRALCVPKPGKAICSVDYGSQEYLISALIAEDDEMVASYFSSDVYLSFAIAAGMCPPDATKETHKAARNLAKAAVLGMSYLMTSIGLSAKLTADTGKLVTEDEAQELIDAFYEVYSELGKWQKNIQKQYAREGFLALPCGWNLWGDNDNFRSVVNFNIQGLGASILRKAVQFCDEAGLKVITTLHDAIYIEYDSADHGAVDTLLDCMKRAFQFYFPDWQKETAGKIKMDPFCWSLDYPAPTITKDKDGKEKKEYASIKTPKGVKVDVSDIYVDERAESEYKQFSKYFENREENSL